MQRCLRIAFHGQEVGRGRCEHWYKKGSSGTDFSSFALSVFLTTRLRSVSPRTSVPRASPAIDHGAGGELLAPSRPLGIGFGKLDAARAEWPSARDRLLFHRGRLLPPRDCSRPTVVRLPAVPRRERLPASVRKPSRRRCLGHRLRRPQCRRLGRRRRRIGRVQRCPQGPAELLGAACPRTGAHCQPPRAAWPPQRGRRASLSSSRAWRVASSTARCSRRN